MAIKLTLSLSISGSSHGAGQGGKKNLMFLIKEISHEGGTGWENNLLKDS